MKFYITLFALTSHVSINAAQVAKVLMPEQENDTQEMFQSIYDQNNVELKKLLQKHPEIVNEMPSTSIVKNTGGVVGWEENTLSALHYAIKINNHEALCILLEHNANPNLQNYYFGETALISAASSDNLDCVKTLIEAGRIKN